MKGIVDDLVRLVKGVSQTSEHHAGSGRKATAQKRLGSHDHLYHQIAEGGKKKTTMSVSTKVRSAAAKEIPLDDDFSDFNT